MSPQIREVSNTECVRIERVKRDETQVQKILDSHEWRITGRHNETENYVLLRFLCEKCGSRMKAIIE